MKISDTDGHFWDIVGNLLHCDESVVEWSFNKTTGIVSLRSEGERTAISLMNLNKLLEENAELIKIRWKTGNTFDGTLTEE